MSAAAESSGRLQRLAEILAESKTDVPSSVERKTDPVDVPLGSVPFDRISRVTSELTRGDGTDIDVIENLAMRLLLDDYTAAVAHLRAVSRLAEQRISTAAIPIREAALHLRRAEKRGVRNGPHLITA